MEKKKLETHSVGEPVGESTWDGCYEGGWNGLIVPEAFAHP